MAPARLSIRMALNFKYLERPVMLNKISDAELNTMQQRCDAKTKGPWGYREDHDYYRGGTYIGYGPQKSIRDESVRCGKSRLISCGISDAEEFEDDVCLLEGSNETANGDFIVHAERDMPRLIAEVKRLREALDVFKRGYP